MPISKEVAVNQNGANLQIIYSKKSNKIENLGLQKLKPMARLNIFPLHKDAQLQNFEGTDSSYESSDKSVEVLANIKQKSTDGKTTEIDGSSLHIRALLVDKRIQRKKMDIEKLKQQKEDAIISKRESSLVWKYNKIDKFDEGSCDKI